MTGIVEPGEVLELIETDYLYGLGSIRIRATEPIAWPKRGIDFVQITGVQLFWNDRERPRTLFVKTAALLRHAIAHHRKPPGVA